MKKMNEKDRAALYYVTLTNKDKIGESTFNDIDKYNTFKNLIKKEKSISALVSYRMLKYVEKKRDINDILEHVTYNLIPFFLTIREKLL